MKEYILIEQMLNGTVTMNTKVSIVKAEDFNKAVEILVGRLYNVSGGTINVEEDKLTYSIVYEEGYRVQGTMENEEPYYIEEIDVQKVSKSDT